MPYDEFGTFYGAEDTPIETPSQADLDRMLLESQVMKQKGLLNRTTPQSYARQEKVLSLLPEQTMTGGSTPIPKEPPKSTATNLPQALMDRLGISTLPQVVMSNVTGYPALLARGMGFNEFADKIQYEPTSKYAGDINEALGEIAQRTGPLPELMFMGKHRTVKPSDVQVLGARGIETGRQLKRLPEDFAASRDYNLTRLGADNEPTIGAKVQKGFESFGDYLARTEGKPRVSIGGMDLANVVPDTKLYAIRNVNEGKFPIAKNPVKGGRSDAEVSGDLAGARLQSMIQRYNPFEPESRNLDSLESEYLQRFVHQNAENFDRSNPIIHSLNLNNEFIEFLDEKKRELFPNVKENVVRDAFNSALSDEQREKFVGNAIKEFANQKLQDRTYQTTSSQEGLTSNVNHRFPTMEEYGQRKEAVDILLNDILPNYYQKFAGTPSDPQLMLAKRGITLDIPENLTTFDQEDPRAGDRTEQRRISAGFNPRGETYPAFEQARAEVARLNQLSGDLNSQAQTKLQELIATIPQGMELNQHPQYREYTPLANEARRVGNQLVAAQTALHNARTALAFENTVDRKLEKVPKSEFALHTQDFEMPFYSNLESLRNDEPVIQGDLVDYRNYTKQGLLIQSLVNDILNGEFPLTDTRQKIKVNGQKVDNPNYGVTDANNIRNVNIGEYIEKITKKRLDAEAKSRKDLMEMTQKNETFAKNFIEEYKQKNPTANDYGSVVPVAMGIEFMTPEEIMQQASLVSWELDHCIGRGGSAPTSMKHHRTGSSRKYIPFKIPHSNEPHPGASRSVEGHIAKMIRGDETNIDFRDSTTGLPIFTMELVHDQNNRIRVYDLVKDELDNYTTAEIRQRFATLTNNFSFGEQERVLNLLATDFPEYADAINRAKNNLMEDAKYSIEYFMGYQDKNTLKDTQIRHRKDIVKYLNDNANQITSTSSYLPDNDIFDKTTHSFKDAIDAAGLPNEARNQLRVKDIPNRFYTVDDVSELYEEKKAELEALKGKSTQRIGMLQNRLAYREFSKHLEEYFKPVIDAGNMSFDDADERSAIASTLRNPSQHYMGGLPILGRDISNMPLAVREYLADKIESEGLHDINADSLPARSINRVHTYYDKLELEKPINYVNTPTKNLQLANQILQEPKKFNLDKLPDDVLMALAEKIAIEGFGTPATTEQIAELNRVPRVLPPTGLQDFVRDVRLRLSNEQEQSLEHATRDFAGENNITNYTQLGENIESYISYLRDKANQILTSNTIHPIQAEGLTRMADALDARLDELVPRQEVLPVEAPRLATTNANELRNQNQFDITDVIGVVVNRAIDNLRQAHPDLEDDFIADVDSAANVDPDVMINRLREISRDNTLDGEYRLAMAQLATSIENAIENGGMPNENALVQAVQGMEAEQPQQLPALQGQQLFDNTLQRLSQLLHQRGLDQYIESVRTNPTTRTELANDIRNMPAAYNLLDLSDAMRESVATHVEHFGIEAPQQLPDQQNEMVDVQQQQQRRDAINAQHRQIMGATVDRILAQIPNHNGNRDFIRNEIQTILNNTADARSAVTMAHDLSMTLVDADQRQYMDNIAQQWEQILLEQPNNPQVQLQAIPTIEQQMGLAWTRIVPQLAPENRFQAHEMYGDAIANAPNGTPAEVVFNLRQMQMPLATTLANFFEEEMANPQQMGNPRQMIDIFAQEPNANDQLLNTNIRNTLVEGNTGVIEAGVGPEYDPLRRGANDIAQLNTVDRIAHWLTLDDGSDRRLFYQIVDELSGMDENNIMQELDGYIDWAEANLLDNGTYDIYSIDENGMNHVLHSLKQLKALLNGEYDVVEYERPQGHKKGGLIKKFQKGGKVRLEDAMEDAYRYNQPSTAPFSLNASSTMPQMPGMIEGLAPYPQNMSMFNFGHNILFDDGTLGLNAGISSQETPAGRATRLSHLGARYHHEPSGLSVGFNKPIGGHGKPRLEINYTKPFANGGAVQKMANGGGLEGLHPLVQQALARGDIKPQYARMLHDMHMMGGSHSEDSPIRGLSQKQYNYYQALLKNPEMQKNFYGGNMPERRPPPVSTMGSDMTREQLRAASYRDMPARPPQFKLGASSDANVYPYTGDLNYYNELKSQAKADPSYQPYQEELLKLEERNPNFKTFRRGGVVKMNEGGGLSDVGKAELAKIQEIIDNLPKRTPVQTPNERLERDTVRLPYQPPKASSIPLVGLQPIPRGGSRIPSTQLELYKKTGGKVVSLAQMKAEMKMRKR